MRMGKMKTSPKVAGLTFIRGNMADYTFDTSGDISDALKITPVKEQTQAMITPSAEETAERHEAEAQEAAANDEKIEKLSHPAGRSCVKYRTC